MEGWIVGFIKDHNQFNLLSEPNFAIYPKSHFPKTHFSNIPVFHHSNSRIAAILSAQELFQEVAQGG